jgi:hypothetical protein
MALRVAFIAACFVLPVMIALAAEIVTVPIDAGNQPLYLLPDENHDLAFAAGRELPDISDVRLHVTGTYGNARSICWNFGDYGGGTWVYAENHGLAIALLRFSEPVCVTTQILLPEMSETVPYDRTFDFDCGSDPEDWSFLADGTGVVRLTGLGCEHSPSYPEVCLCDHSATVDSAELLITLGTGVAVARNSWTAIKGLYR